MGIQRIIGFIIICLIILIGYRYYFMSKLIDGVWIASDNFRNASGVQELVLVIDGGIMSKSISLTVNVGGESVTDIGVLNIYPEFAFCPTNFSTRSSCDIKSMDGLTTVKLGIDGSILFEGDKTYFEGIRL